MFNFENALLSGRSEIPLEEASSFFLGMRTPTGRSLQKTAGLLDMPDEAGSLEGQFTVPVETVSALIGVILSKLFGLTNASMLYANTIRGPVAAPIRCILNRGYEQRNVIEYLTARATVLAGAVHVADIEPPPPITDPVAAAQSFIRGTQEVIQGLQSLHSVMGTNPMRERISSFMSSFQSDIDDMWRALEPEAQPVTIPGLAPGDADSVVGMEETGEPAEMSEMDQEVVASVKTAAASMVKWAKETPADAELKETGRQRAVASIAAEQERDKSRRGERAGRALGAAGGLAAGGALGRKLIGGKAGTIAGAAMGGLAGKALGGELGTEVDIRRGKTASALLKTAAAQMVNWVKVAQDAPIDNGSPMSAPTDQPELEPLNYMQAEQMGRRQQEQSEALFYKRRAQSVQQQATMAIQQAQQQAEMATQQAQQVVEQAETAGEKVQQALGEAMTAKDEALRQAETAARIRMSQQDLRLKLMELASQEPDMQAAMNLAVTTGPPPEPPPIDPMAAQGQPAPMTADAAKETDQAARAQGEAEQQTAQAAAKQASAGFPDAGLYEPVGASGPAGKSATPRTSPGSAPIAGGADMNANSGGPPGLNGQGAMPATKLSHARVKTAGPLGGVIGGLGGALASGISTHSDYRAGVDPAIAEVQQLEQAQDGSFSRAAALARARKEVADRQLQQGFPNRVLLGNVARGAMKAAPMGSTIENNIRKFMR